MIKKVYLDNAATTEMYDEVIDVMLSAMKNQFGNPSSTHSFGMESKALIEQARRNIANIFNASPNEIIFTSCGTESNNIVLRSCVEHFDIQRIITTELEHKCVYETCKDLQEMYPELEVKYLTVSPQGDIDLDELETLLKEDKKTLVTLMHANNELGNLYDIHKIAELCKMHNALYHADTVQTLGHIPMDLSEIPLDFASCSAHKFHGPKGAGFIFVRKSNKLKPLITGGGQERNIRSGTENVYGIVGMDKALEISTREYENHKQKIEAVKQYCIDRLKEKFPNVVFNGHSADLNKSLYTVLNISLPINNDLFGFQLNMKGIGLSQGSACSSGANKPSRVMELLKPNENLEEQVNLRISFSHYNTKEDIDYLVQCIEEISQEKAFFI